MRWWVMSEDEMWLIMKIDIFSGIIRNYGYDYSAESIKARREALKQYRERYINES